MGWGDKWDDDKVLNTWPVSIPFKEMEEAAKVYADAHSYGTGFSQDSKHIPLDKIYNNTSPTHDPYTNPNAHIYYECDCGAILDPGTKSFAALNNCASEKGWKIRFGETGYIPYCVKCGEGIE